MKNTLRALTNVTATPDYTPETVKALIKRLKLNEKTLALLMNVSPMTVRLWTSGAVKPCGLSRRLLQLYELCPDIIDVLARNQRSVSSQRGGATERTSIAACGDARLSEVRDDEDGSEK
ncbi:MAG: XRE family transcriptional regulator [Oscillospiraceae bacterium]|jgi:putative transcriptional regulator|nr:XRE family transcriptional regulator [Oscillospiraceae bacterium]